MDMGHAAGYVGLPAYLMMWMAMMVPMMLPSLVPMLLRYRRSAQGVRGVHLHGLTVVVGSGYYAVWAGLGVGAWAASAGVMGAEMRWGWVGEWRPVATGVVLLVAGAVQASKWKARQLVMCREGSGCGGPAEANARSASRHGIELGLQCLRCCGSLMLALLAVGMMPVAMVAVTVVIAAERLAPVPLGVARLAGTLLVMLGVVGIVRM